MAIRGSLREASLPDVLQLLAMGKKTGCLSVTHRHNFGYIYFEKGRITYASIVNRRDRLGDMLVKSGTIRQSELDATVTAQDKRPDRRLGELLVEQGIISTEQLQRFIRIQIEEAVYFLFTWTQGTFNFEADVFPDHQDLLVSINPESLLLEGARRVDEWGLIEKKVPSFDVVFELDHDRVSGAEVELTAEQTAILPLLDGVRDVQGIVDATGMVEFDVGKALYGLATAGFVQRVGTSARAPVEAPSTDGRIEEHRNLGVAFYRTAMFDESLREFRRVLELRPGDLSAQTYVGLALCRQQRWEEAVTVLTESAAKTGAPAAVFHNLAFALERMGRLTDAQAALDQAVRRRGDDPRTRTSLAVLHLLGGDAVSADEAFEAAREAMHGATPPAVWFHYAALAAALRGDAQRAVGVLRSGVAAHPGVAALANNLGAMLERVGRTEEARETLERALLEEAPLPQTLKNLGDLHYRAARYDDAFESYQRAVKLSPDLGDDVYLKLGNIRLRRQERGEAVRCWERALELDPENAIVRTNLDAVRGAV